MLLSFNDICLVPAVISNIEHRSECNPYLNNGMLPLFTAPMTSVINENNWQIFRENKINTIIPRSVSFQTRHSLYMDTFVAVSLSEFEDLIEYDKPIATIYICVDIANGHMKKLLNLCKQAKKRFGDMIQIMAGNIANPETYFEYAKAGIDYVRCGIGGGSCCFVAGTKVTMANGTRKNIEDIDVGEQVKTIFGNQKVVSTFKKTTDSTIMINNKIKCTPDHKFLVINKKDKDKVTENNLSEYSFYIEAKNLTSEYLLVEDKIV